MANKGQGLPFNVVVLAGIAVLVLAVVAAFTIGGGGTGLTKLSRSAGVGAPDELQNTRLVCENLCNQATAENFRSSNYCRATNALDLSGDGDVSDAGESTIKCWEDPINQGCSKTLRTATGAVRSIDESACVTSATLPP